MYDYRAMTIDELRSLRERLSKKLKEDDTAVLMRNPSRSGKDSCTYRAVYKDKRSGKYRSETISADEYRERYIKKRRKRLTRAHICFIDRLIKSKASDDKETSYVRHFVKSVRESQVAISEIMAIVPRKQDMSNYPEQLRYETKRGELVRSKSEQIIANVLYKYGIPYEYEYKLEVDGMTYVPDFVIFDGFSPDIVVWEHFGMMDDANYALNAVEKLAHYKNAGLELNENLIGTFEGKQFNRKIDEPYIEEIVKEKILAGVRNWRGR